jgi:hypothetical protein
MRLVSYGPFGSECAGFLDGDKVIDLEQAMKVTGAEKPVSNIRLFLEQPNWRSTLDRAYAARSKVVPATPSRIGAPVPVPRTLIIAGANTKSHIAEAGADLLGGGDKRAKNTHRLSMCRLRERPLSHNPANSAHFARSQELSGITRLRGGPGRTRTSNQTVMSEAPTLDDQENSDT